MPRVKRTTVENAVATVKKPRVTRSYARVKYEAIDDAKVTTIDVNSATKKIASGRSTGQNVTVKVLTPSENHSAEPRNFREIYKRVSEMRKLKQAPVDTMGCDKLHDQTIDPKDSRFQMLIALMLSAQTKDEINSAAMKKLKEGIAGGLTLEGVRKTSVADINTMIYQVGFHNRKASYIKQTAEILLEKFDGDIPQTVEDMCKLPGVGPKMAHLLIQVAWDKVEGVGVDVHVHRLANQWGWVKSKTPEGTRLQLEAWLPREYWKDINPLLVGFGQTICLPRGPKCSDCTLTKSLCPSRKGTDHKIKDLEDLVG